MPDQNFRLPTLRLGTDFDEPVTLVQLPAVLRRGQDPSMCILDGADRAPHRLSRMVRPVGLLGVKMADPTQSVRVRMVLLADERAAMMWDRERARLIGEDLEYDEDGERIAPDLSAFHRLVEIGAQGRPRATALLSWRPADGQETRTVVEFEVAAEEIGDSGLVMFEFREPDAAPQWALEGHLAGGLTGVCVVRIELEQAGRPVSGLVSTGRPDDEDGAGVVGRRPGFFVVNPRGDGGAQRIALEARAADDERLAGRRAKVKHPVRYAREWGADRRVRLGGTAVVDVVDLEGRPVEAAVQSHGDRHTVELPAGVGPVFVRPRLKRGADHRAISWRARVGD